MSRRDTWARLTPYEVGVPGREFADKNFAAIRKEAETRGVDDTDPGAFLLLGEVGRVLKEIQGEERGGEALHQFGAFLFHAYHFHRAGEPILLAETQALRGVVEGRVALDGWEGGLPADAGYLQLPRHLVWSHPDPDGAAEDLDGIFWARSRDETLSLMVAMGIRTQRPGLSVVPLPPVPLSDAPGWPRSRVREAGEGDDFTTTLPGGELDELYSVIRAGEILKLVAGVFSYLERHPEALGAREEAPHPEELTGPGEEAGPEAGERMAGARPTLLPYRRIRAMED